MTMPHQIFKQKCEKELLGLSGDKRANKVDELLSIMSGYKSGPYAEVRKWLHSQKDKAITSKKMLHLEKWEVKKQGHFTFSLIGFPSVGKSSLVKKITGAQIEVAEYDFTTIKPFSAIFNYDNVHIQLIDLPGIIKGASEGKGFGKRVLGNALISDKVLFVIDSTKPSQLTQLIHETTLFGFKPTKENTCVIFTKSDLAKSETNLFRYCNFSINDSQTTTTLKDFLFKETSLIRVFPYNSKSPIILKNNSTVEDFCDTIHKELKIKFKFALVTGKSAKFQKQRVSLSHVLKDLDTLELLLNH